MTERIPDGPSLERLQRLETMAIDRATLDAAIEDDTSTRAFKKIYKQTWQGEIHLRFLFDAHSGRVSEAVASEEKTLKPRSHEGQVEVYAVRTTEVDAQGRIVEETMVFTEKPDIVGPDIAPLARGYIEDLLSDWREAHNRYIGHAK